MKDLFENNCDVVSDLLPLYADGCCSEKTARLLQAHLSVCKSCHKRLLSIKKSSQKPRDSVIPEPEPDFSGLSSRLRRRRTLKNTLLSLTIFAAAVSTLLLAVTHDCKSI